MHELGVKLQIKQSYDTLENFYKLFFVLFWLFFNYSSSLTQLFMIVLLKMHRKSMRAAITQKVEGMFFQSGRNKTDKPSN